MVLSCVFVSFVVLIVILYIFLQDLTKYVENYARLAYKIKTYKGFSYHSIVYCALVRLLYLLYRYKLLSLFVQTVC